MKFIAWKNLFHDKTRFLISVLGISFAILLMFAIRGITHGIGDTAAKYALNQDVDLFIFQKGAQNMQMTSTYLPSSLIGVIADIEGIEEAEGIYGMNFQYRDGKLNIPSYLVGFRENGGPWLMKEGRQKPSQDEVILDYAFALKAGMEVGDQITIMDKELKVIGISRDTNPLGGLFIFVNKLTMDEILDSDEIVNIILVKATEGSNVNSIARNIEEKLPVVSVVPAVEVAENEASMITDMFDPIVNAIMVVILVVSTAFIGLTIYNATLERIEEYTILKAIGANKFQLFSIIIFQSTSISLVGTILGFVLLKFAAFLTYRFMPDVTMTASLSLSLKYLWIIPVMSLLAAYLPLTKIYKIDEGDVLRR